MIRTYTQKPLWESLLAAFLEIAGAWNLTEREQADLLGTMLEQLSTWRARPWIDLLRETMTRVSDVLAVHRALGFRFESSDEQSEWLRQPGAVPGVSHEAPLAIMRTASGLRQVRDILEANLQGW